MISCLANCKPGDILVWFGEEHHVVVEISDRLVYAKSPRGFLASFHSDDVLQKSITKIIKKQRNESLQSNTTL
jgi:hypothetical protein